MSRGARVAGGGALAALGLALLAPQAARAHSLLAIGDFYNGLLQAAFHLESLLLFLALALFAGPLSPPHQGRVPAAFALASLAGSALALAGVPLTPALWLVRGGALALALLVAAKRQPLALGYVLVALAGLGVGHVALYDDREALARPLLYALGLALAPLILSGVAIETADRFRSFWVRVGFRVVGSWIATISLLVSALALAAKR